MAAGTDASLRKMQSDTVDRDPTPDHESSSVLLKEALTSTMQGSSSNDQVNSHLYYDLAKQGNTFLLEHMNSFNDQAVGLANEGE